ncbi:hypothetical protein F5I97DRAFT_160243 [Phlebopus sp. FC_14]|nr:hypothetical protein F5I97DRAFT_160243 [Phlebopus sp. FC_14]
MRRFLASKGTSPSHAKGKQPQRDPEGSVDAPAPSPMEVLVHTEVHSSVHDHGFQPLSSTSTLVPSSSSSSPRPLPPGIRVPTHPYPYWQHHTPSSSSQSSLESPVTPSHVSWLSGTNPNSGDPSSSTHTLGRSSPKPHFPPPPPTSPPANVTRPKLTHPTKSTHSLRVPVQEFFGQQLSPIVEQDYLSPEKRPVSLPSSSHEGSGTTSSITQTMVTPISPITVTPVSPVPISPVIAAARGTPPTPVTPSHAGIVPFTRRREDDVIDSPRPSPVFSTFLSRPLNRSISISSTRTHQSSSSATPPVIPPLDLRPEFKGPFLTTPTSMNSRELLDVAYDDADDVSDHRESFVTARTATARESRYSTAIDHDDPGEILESACTGQHPPPDGDSQKQSELHVLPQPPPLAHLITHPRPSSRTSSYPPSYSYPPVQHEYHPHRPTLSAFSLRSLSSLPSPSDSFIDRRFADSDLYVNNAAERASARIAGQQWKASSEKVYTVRMLFWFGFIAPWCWLIGGWLVASKKRQNLGRGGSLLPLWTGRSMQSVETVKFQHGYPFVAPSVLTLTPPSYTRVILTPKHSRETKNPWVRRCRVAAITSGIITVVGFVTALVVAAGSS